MRVFALCAVLAVSSTTGCGAAPPSPLGPVLVTQQDARSFTVSVAGDPSITGKDAQEVIEKGHWTTALPESLQAALQAAGFRVVGGGAPADVLATIRATYVSTADIGANTGARISVTLTSSSDQQLVARAERAYGCEYQCVTYDDIPDRAANDLTGQLLRSSEVVAFARSRAAGTSATVASLPSPPPPPAAAQSSTPSNGAFGASFDQHEVVTGVVIGSPADACGLDVGDDVLAVNGVSVASLNDLVARIRGLAPGAPVTLLVARGGARQTLNGVMGATTDSWLHPAHVRTAVAANGAPFVRAAPQPGAYALVIGVEHYRDIPAAPGAAGDAQTMAQLMRQTFGLSEEHLRVLIDDHATKTDMASALDWLVQSAAPGGQVFFYYGGHGAPASDQSSYVLPYEANLQNITDSGIALKTIMDRLAQSRAHDVLALVDSCFSGAGGRSVLPAGARPLMRVHDTSAAAQVALYTASAGDEYSASAPGETGGVFTKFVSVGLGKGLADGNGDGQISLAELAAFVAPRVAQDAQRAGHPQHPQLVVGSAVTPAEFEVAWGYPSN